MSNTGSQNLSDAQGITAESQSGAVNIAKRIHKVMLEVGYVYKDGKNTFQKYNYASEANAIKAIRPALVKNGLILLPSVQKSEMDSYGNTTVHVLYKLMDVEGNFITFQMIGQGNDKNSKGVGDKGVYKAITGANKYALLKTFLLETGDDPEVESDHDKESESKSEKSEPKSEDYFKTKQDIQNYVLEMKGYIQSCKTEKDLVELWQGNKPLLDTVKKKNESSYNDLLDLCKYTKAKINGEKNGK